MPPLRHLSLFLSLSFLSLLSLSFLCHLSLSLSSLALSYLLCHMLFAVCPAGRPLGETLPPIRCCRAGGWVGWWRVAVAGGLLVCCPMRGCLDGFAIPILFFLHFGVQADVTALLASPLAGVHGVEGVEGGLGVEEGFAEGVTPMVTCAGCGAPEVHTPHKILEVRRSNTGGGGGGIVVRTRTRTQDSLFSVPFSRWTIGPVCRACAVRGVLYGLLVLAQMLGRWLFHPFATY